ncbi:MAG: hypothetical protein AB1668_02015 [Nanoarchaeota archaeon]
MKKSLIEPSLNFGISEEMSRLFMEKFAIGPNSLEGFGLLKDEFCRNNPLLQVKYAPTGFMYIKKDVLETLHKYCKKYLSDRRAPHQVFFSEKEAAGMQVAEMFPVSVQEGVLESEDWGFCRLCAENEIKVFLHTEVVVEHHGLICFHPRHFCEG